MKTLPKVIPLWLWGVVVAIIIYCAVACCYPQHLSPSGKPFPRLWGKPPDIQLTDVVPLPDGYGNGSSTLRYWIMENKK